MKFHGPQSITRVLPASLAVAGSLLLPSIAVYAANRDQFALSTTTAGGIFLTGMLGLTLGAGGILWLFRGEKWFRMANAAAFALCVNLFLQYHCWSNFFTVSDPASPVSSDLLILFIAHVVFLAAPLAVAIIFRAFIARHSWQLATVILLSQMAGVIPFCLDRRNSDYDFLEYTFSDQDKFTFGSEENIIILVVDAMGENICKQVLEQYPEVRTALRDFTGFDRMTSPIPRTMYAVPALLTGVNFPCGLNGEPGNDDHAEYLNRACRSENSLFTALKQKGFRTEGYPFILQTISYAPEVIDNSIPLNYRIQEQSLLKLFDTVLARQVPGFLHPYLQNIYYIATEPFVTPAETPMATSRDAFDRTFYRRLSEGFRVGSVPKVFKYLHLHGAHGPVRTDEYLELNQETLKYRQLRGSLRNLELLLTKLRQARLYDRSTIVVTGDHTEIYEREVIAFIKRPGEHHEFLQFNSVPCQISDLAGTVLKIAGNQTSLKSLYELPAQPGNGRRRTDENVYLDFANWHSADCKFDISNRKVSAYAFLMEKNRIIVEFDSVSESETLGELAVFAYAPATGRLFVTAAHPNQFPNYLRTSPVDFPDGAYWIFLQKKWVGQDGKSRDSIRVLPKFLLMEKGRGSFSDMPPNSAARPMRIGENIRFQVLEGYPQLVLPENRPIRAQGLLLNERMNLGVRIPGGERNLALDMTLACQNSTPGTLVIYTNGHEATRCAIANIDPVSCSVPLPVEPDSSAEDAPLVTLHFEFIPAHRSRVPSALGCQLNLETITLARN